MGVTHVFSAHAEVVPTTFTRDIEGLGILRARGGSSTPVAPAGSTGSVFSAHAEVVPSENINARVDQRILRARGGSSLLSRGVEQLAKYSPRTRR